MQPSASAPPPSVSSSSSSSSSSLSSPLKCPASPLTPSHKRKFESSGNGNENESDSAANQIHSARTAAAQAQAQAQAHAEGAMVAATATATVTPTTYFQQPNQSALSAEQQQQIQIQQQFQHQQLKKPFLASSSPPQISFSPFTAPHGTHPYAYPAMTTASASTMQQQQQQQQHHHQLQQQLLLQQQHQQQLQQQLQNGAVMGTVVSQGTYGPGLKSAPHPIYHISSHPSPTNSSSSIPFQRPAPIVTHHSQTTLSTPIAATVVHLPNTPQQQTAQNYYSSSTNPANYAFYSYPTLAPQHHPHPHPHTQHQQQQQYLHHHGAYYPMAAALPSDLYPYPTLKAPNRGSGGSAIHQLQTLHHQPAPQQQQQQQLQQQQQQQQQQQVQFSGNGTTSSPSTLSALPPLSPSPLSPNIRSNSYSINHYLASVPLLAKLSATERELLASALTEREYAAGAPIVTEGEEATEFFIIKSGQAKVTRVTTPAATTTMTTNSNGRVSGVGSPATAAGPTGTLSPLSISPKIPYNRISPASSVSTTTTSSLNPTAFPPASYSSSSTLYPATSLSSPVAITPPSSFSFPSSSSNRLSLNSELCILCRGDYFGELGLLSSSRRGATVTAITPVVCFVLSQSNFHHLFGPNRLNITFAKRTAVSAETFNSRSSHNNISNPNITPIDAVREKTEAQLQMILNVINANVLFSKLDLEEKYTQVIAPMWFRTIPAGTNIIVQGDVGDHWYLVNSGQFEIFVKPQENQPTNGNANETKQQLQIQQQQQSKPSSRSASPTPLSISSSSTAPSSSSPLPSSSSPPSSSSSSSSISPYGIKVATRTPGSSFGELALLYNAPRAATVRALVDSTVWVLDRWTFRRALYRVGDQRLREYEEFLKKVDSFNVLLEHERSRIAEALEEVTYPANHDIVRQGEVGDTFFLLKRGEVVVHAVDPATGLKRELARYNKGEFFGERSIVKQEVRAATVTSVTSVDCLYLHRDAFDKLLGPMEVRVKTHAQKLTEYLTS